MLIDVVVVGESEGVEVCTHSSCPVDDVADLAALFLFLCSVREFVHVYFVNTSKMPVRCYGKKNIFLNKISLIQIVLNNHW